MKGGLVELWDGVFLHPKLRKYEPSLPSTIQVVLLLATLKWYLCTKKK